MLQGGYAKRSTQQKSDRLKQRRVEDMQKIKDMPEVGVLKDGVRRAMNTLMHISTMHRQSDKLDAKTRTEANACMTGIIFLNGYAGRCGEWSRLSYEHFESQMNRNLNYILCSTHKTSHQYGDPSRAKKTFPPDLPSQSQHKKT
jgi:hypothetical protein